MYYPKVPSIRTTLGSSYTYPLSIHFTYHDAFILFPQFICKWLTTNPTNSIYPRLQTQKNSIELFVSSTVNRHICYEQWENEVKPKNNEGNKVTVKVQKWYKR